jgi:NAD(P)-dependent dehydrogenase (short-subunit alcohol dehydrogenase family)/thioester reductase-like protein
VFHLAAVYDMQMDDETADRVNNEGTRHVVRFTEQLGGKPVLHHVSSIAIAGAHHRGVFDESMFEVGQRLDHPYYRSKFESERIVRAESKVPYRIYRPGIVVGHSVTGEIDKVDGPYYFFPAIKALSGALPRWLPMLGIEGGRIALAPVDYIAAAMDVIAHKPGLDGKAFFLVQSPSPSAGELIQVLLGAAHGPEVTAQLELPRLTSIGRKLAGRLGKLMPKELERSLEESLGLPLSVVAQAFNETVFDDREARAALKGSGVRCPDFRDYAQHLWSYWQQQHAGREARSQVPLERMQKLWGKVVLVTGASSGIGLVTAKRLAACGARVLLVARRRDELEAVRADIERAGGEAYVFPCDLANGQAIDSLVESILREFGHVDVLINNAGRSIRRSVFESLDRFHDFERTMQLNYFGAVRLTMQLLPAMRRRDRGHIINVSSIAVLSNVPLYSAYAASKAALDAFGRALASEVRAHDIAVTSIYMPLVRTPMIAPTKLYDHVPTWTPETAADTIVEAILTRPKKIASPLGTFAAINYALWPKLNDLVLSLPFQLAHGTLESAKPVTEPREQSAQDRAAPGASGANGHARTNGVPEAQC